MVGGRDRSELGRGPLGVRLQHEEGQLGRAIVAGARRGRAEARTRRCLIRSDLGPKSAGTASRRPEESVSMGDDDPRDLVRRGYDALSYHYRGDDADGGQYTPWLNDLLARLPAAADVLDLGCGCGVPGARSPANAGHRVTGVDISDVQIRRARGLVPKRT